MPLSPAQIKEKLLKGIDADSNVTNPAIVIEVIDILEKVALTKTDLEVTRLGLFINLIRRKTPNKDISKRCKKLIKSWQQIISSASNQSSPASGYSPALSRTPNLTCPSPKLTSHSSSPNLQSHGRVVSPAVHAGVQGRVASPALGRTVSPLVRQSQGSNGARATFKKASVSPASTAYANKRISPANSRLTTPTTQYSQHFSPNSSNLSTPTVTRLTESSRPITPTNNNHAYSTPTNIDSGSRANVANKKRRRSEESETSDTSSFKRTKSIVNGESKATERTKTPRVKTTVQLIAELQAQNTSSNLTTSDTITKIVTNQIEKEEDDIRLSVVPAGAKPRPRKKNGSLVKPPEAPNDMSYTKSDLVHRFLQTAQPKSNIHHNTGEDVDVDIMAVDGVMNHSYTPHKPVIDLSIDPYSLLPPLDYASITWSDDEDDYSPNHKRKAKRNPITGEYPEGMDCSSGDEDDIARIYGVAKILNEDWPGVNGSVAQSSSTNEFHEWTDTLVIKPSKDNKDDVYVLPYVDL